MLEPKVPAIGASIGFVLSFLTGLFSGASFSVLLIRALCMAVLFGVLAVFARIVIIRFIPELLEEQTTNPGTDEKIGNVVDITVGDNLKVDNPFGMYDGNGGGSGMVPDFLEHSESMSSELSSKSTFPEMDSASSNISMDEHNSVPSFINSGAVGGKGSLNGLDVLPDLQDFVPPDVISTGDDSTQDEPLSVDFGSGKSSMSSDILGSSMESDTMVKAIRTILSRDK